MYALRFCLRSIFQIVFAALLLNTLPATRALAQAPSPGLPEALPKGAVTDATPQAEEPDNEAAEEDAGTPADRSDQLLQEFAGKGLRELGQFPIGKNPQAQINLKIAITAAAEAIIAQRKFDLPDNNFNLLDFTKGLAGEFADGIQYFQQIVPDSRISEFYVVIDDLAEKRKTTISSAKTNSRLILADIRRWHKLYRGQRSYLSTTTSIHEFVHLVNYRLDPKEEKLHRELVAICFELLNFRRKGGQKAFDQLYLKAAAGPLREPRQVLDTKYTSNTPLRYIAHFFFRKVYDGTFPVAGQSLPALERFAALYLASPQMGYAGFNDACREAKITAADGTPLTLRIIQNQLYAELTGNTAPPEEQPNSRR